MRVKTLRCLMALGLLVIVGCSGNSSTRIETGGTERISARLDDTQAVLVTTPKDISYEGKPIKGTGVAVARRIDASFSRYARLVDVSAADYHAFADLQGTIADNGYGYIVVPKILHWVSGQDHWSKIPSMVSVKIDVIDAGSGKTLSSNIVEGRNPSVTINPLSWFASHSDNPEELLVDPLDDDVDSFYECAVCAYF